MGRADDHIWCLQSCISPTNCIWRAAGCFHCLEQLPFFTLEHSCVQRCHPASVGTSGICLISNCSSVTYTEKKASCFNASASKAVLQQMSLSHWVRVVWECLWDTHFTAFLGVRGSAGFSGQMLCSSLYPLLPASLIYNKSASGREFTLVVSGVKRAKVIS